MKHHWIITHDNLESPSPTHYLVTTEKEKLAPTGGSTFEGDELKEYPVNRIIKLLGISIKEDDFICIDESDQPKELEQEKTFQVTGSWGTLTVSTETGYVREYDPDGTLPDHHNPSERGYMDIERIDVAEYREHAGDILHGLSWSLDILDVGYWREDGTYEPHLRERHK